MLNWINKKRNKKGFTLIELVVVVAILGILAALAIPRFTGVRDSAAKNTILADARTINSAMEVYYAEKGVYPPVSSGVPSFGDPANIEFTGTITGYVINGDSTYDLTYVNKEGTYKIVIDNGVIGDPVVSP